ncbi:MAG: hypothetical protein ACQETB_10900 [Halobacteriota archaeon]
MREVEVSYAFSVPREEIESRLDPRSIVEYQATFEVEAIEETPDGWRLVAVNEDIEPDSRSVLEFEATERGYVYEQVERGVFEALHTEITVEETDADEGSDEDERGGERTRVTARSSFTFGGPLAFLKDWFAAASRRQELERFMRSLAHDLEPDGEADEGSVRRDG